jgi:methionine-rich copper-binding protein CopC
VSGRLAAPALLATVALTIAQGGAALAHANYFRSSPAPNMRLDRAPDRVVVGFSEAPDPKQSGIDLLAPDGRTVASGAETTADPTEIAVALPALAPSTYLVAWHTVSAVDGDAAHGYFAFAVGPDTPSNGSVTQSADASGTHATLTVSPGRVGANEYRVHVTDATGGALANVTRVRLLITDLDRDLGTSTVLLPATGTDYAAIGMELGLAGRFSIQLEVRRRDVLDDLIYKLSAQVPTAVMPTATAPASATVIAAGSPTAAPASPSSTLPSWSWLIVPIAILIGAVGIWTLRRRATR